RDEMKLCKEILHLSECLVGGIRPRPGNQVAPVFIPLPHQTRITLECARSCEFFGIEFRPEAGLRIAKSWHPAFGRNAGASQHDNTCGGLKAFDQLRWNSHALDSAPLKFKKT